MIEPIVLCTLISWSVVHPSALVERRVVDSFVACDRLANERRGWFSFSKSHPQPMSMPRDEEFLRAVCGVGFRQCFPSKE
jgi:hypothetical protein